MAVFAPIPSAKVRTIVAAKPGARRSCRSAYRRFWTRACTIAEFSFCVCKLLQEHPGGQTAWLELAHSSVERTDFPESNCPQSATLPANGQEDRIHLTTCNHLSSASGLGSSRRNYEEEQRC